MAENYFSTQQTHDVEMTSVRRQSEVFSLRVDSFGKKVNRRKKKYHKSCCIKMSVKSRRNLCDRCMICDVSSFSTVFQLYQDDGLMVINGYVQWNFVYG